jgi:hypothetical protein
MLKALGILLFAVTLEASFLYTIVAPRVVEAEASDAAAVAARLSSERVVMPFDGPARRW